jgi:hypothetical protein
MSNRLALASLAMILAWIPPVAAARPLLTMFVAVMDQSGQPVTGLTAADFKVTLGSDDCPVVSAGRSTEPIALVIAPAGFRRDVLPMRNAVAAVEDILSHEPRGYEVGVAWQTVRGVTFRRPGETGGLIHDFNQGLSDSPALDDGIISATKALATRTTMRRIVLALAQHVDFGGYPDDVRRALEKVKAVLWGVEVEPVGANGTSDTDKVLTMISPWTGGRTEQILDINLIEAATRRQMNLLANEYTISFEPPDRISPNGSLRIAVRRAGVRILSPPWAS